MRWGSLRKERANSFGMIGLSEKILNCNFISIYYCSIPSHTLTTIVNPPTNEWTSIEYRFFFFVGENCWHVSIQVCMEWERHVKKLKTNIHICLLCLLCACRAHKNVEFYRIKSEIMCNTGPSYTNYVDHFTVLLFIHLQKNKPAEFSLSGICLNIGSSLKF